VLAEDEALDAELDAVGGPGFEAGVGFHGAAALVVDGHGVALGEFDEIHFGDDAPAFGGEGDGAGGAEVGGGEIGGRGEGTGAGVDLFVLEGAFDGVGAFGEEVFDPLVEEEAGAVGELIHHAGGEVVGELGLRSGEDGPAGFGAHVGVLSGRAQTMMQGASKLV